MGAIKLLSQLKNYPLFGAGEVTEALSCGERYANLILMRLCQKKIIKRASIGKYTSCNLAQTIATNLVTPSYISGWYALRVHNLTEQLPQQIDVLTTRKKNDRIISFNQERIVYKTIGKKYLFGYTSEPSEEYIMNLASIEKAVIDSLYFELAPLSAIISAIKIGEGKISVEQLGKISLRFKNVQFLKKAGFILDSLGYDLYPKFKKHLNYNPVIMNRSLCNLLDRSKLKKWGIKCQ